MRLQNLKKILPTVLTCIGTVGVFVTGYLVHKGTKKAYNYILEENENISELTKKEEFKKTWKFYIPAAAAAVVTSASTIGAQALNTIEIASLAATATYAVTNRDKLKKKFEDVVGKEKMEEIKKDILPEMPRWSSQTIEDTGKGSEHDRILCFEGYSGRWFWSTKDAVLKAEQRLNDLFTDEKYCCLNDFYAALGIERTHFGYQFGWVNDEDYYIGPIMFTNSEVFYEEKNCNVYIIEIDTYPMECWMEI